MSEWVRQSKGIGVIYKHPKQSSAIVDRRGMGLFGGITFQGVEYPTIEAAMSAAERTQDERAG